MKKMLIAAIATLFVANAAFAADASCAARAAEKKLHGAAKNSFVKKCEGLSKQAGKAAASPCAAKAAGKKLHGAAKNSFVKKCEKDAAAAK